MKYIRVNPKTSYLLNPALVISGIAVFCYLPFLAYDAFYGLWLSTLCVLYYLISPVSKKRLAHDEEDIALRLPFRQWFFSILLLECMLLGMYLGIAFISGRAFPINNEMHPALFTNSVRFLLMHYGLFPWTVYALMSVGMGILAYQKQSNAYFSELLKPLSGQDEHGVYGLTANIGMRRAVVLVLALSLIFMVLLISDIIAPLSTYMMHGFEPTALLGTTIIVSFSFSKQLRKITNHLFSRKIPILWGFLIYTLAIALILLLLSAISAGFWKTEAAGMPDVPNLVMKWIHIDWSSSWLFLSMLWWLFLTPLVAAFITHISRGYRIRDVLLGVLALPFCLCIILNLPLYFSMPVALIKSISLLSFLFGLPILINHKRLSQAIMAYYPKNGEIKARDQHSFFNTLTGLIAILLACFLVIGVNGISLLVFSTNYFLLFTVLMITIAMMRQLFLKQFEAKETGAPTIKSY